MGKASRITTGEFWAAAGERALATFAQTLVALIGVDAVTPIESLDWATMLSSAALAGLLSVLKSVGAGAATGTPSIGHLEQPTPHPGVGGKYPGGEVPRDTM